MYFFNLICSWLTTCPVNRMVRGLFLFMNSALPLAAVKKHTSEE
jgi:hypothetical protein